MSIMSYPQDFEEEWKSKSQNLKEFTSRMDQLQTTLLDNEAKDPTGYNEVHSEALLILSSILEDLYIRIDWFIEFGLIGLLSEISASRLRSSELEKVYQILSGELLGFMQETRDPLLDAKGIPRSIQMLKNLYRRTDPKSTS
jgi:hypothetical protein